jgi:hypothetical protein
MLQDAHTKKIAIPVAAGVGSNTLASFVLDAGQGITEQDEPGMDGVPRFECRPGEAFIIEVTGGTFNGALDYSLRY